MFAVDGQALREAAARNVRRYLLTSQKQARGTVCEQAVAPFAQQTPPAQAAASPSAAAAALAASKRLR
jgi:hypothetical protein